VADWVWELASLELQPQTRATNTTVRKASRDLID
jgi:hypothetical protein